MFNPLYGELLGKKVKVIESTDPGKIGIEGVVIDETKNILVLKTEKGVKKIPKAECTFLIEAGKRIYKVSGKLLVGRPEERIRKGLRLAKKWRI